jgi:hypothetical protein
LASSDEYGPVPESDLNDNSMTECWGETISCGEKSTVTLLKKLDALHRRAPNERIDPPAFVRHFEDAAKIVLAEASLAPLPHGLDARMLAIEMEREKQLAGLPSSFDPAFQIPANPRGDAIRAASDAIAPMFWGKRIPIDEACSTISAWIRRRLE